MNNTIKVRIVAADICDRFEHVLDKYDITVPDEERTGVEGEARLYGLTYFNLEQDIVGLLKSLIEEVKSKPDAQCEYNDY